jgi:hypothetical protein
VAAVTAHTANRCGCCHRHPAANLIDVGSAQLLLPLLFEVVADYKWLAAVQ